MRKWKAITGIVLVFLLGAAAGALVSYKIYHQRVEKIMRSEPGTMREEFIVRRLGHDLRLDPPQMGQLRVIVQETHSEIRSARRQCGPRIDEILNRSHDRIRAILSPEQREKFEKGLEERKKRREGPENDH